MKKLPLFLTAMSVLLITGCGEAGDIGGMISIGISVFVVAVILNIISRRSIKEYLVGYLVAIGFIILGILVEYNPELGIKKEPTSQIEQSFFPNKPKVNFTRNSIEILNFPNVLLGRTGLNSVNWSKEYDFDSLNKKIYKKLSSGSFNSNSISINVKIERENKYGNKSYQTYNIGTYDFKEAKRYSDYSHWKRQNDIEKIAERFLVKTYSGQ